MTTTLPTPSSLMPVSTQIPPVTIVALIAQARGVPSAARERFAAECERLQSDNSVIVLHTCHRVELYVAVDTFDEKELPELPVGGLRLEDAAAVRHLIRVASGLESAVLGEDQVLHQVRQAYTSRRATAPLDPVLDRLFQVALSAGRRAHGWFAGSRRSLGDAALDEIEGKVGSLKDRPILIVGAGSMGRLTAQAASRRGALIIVTSRSAERALGLARDVKGLFLECAIDGTLPPVVGAVIALSGQWQVHPMDSRTLVESGATVVDLSAPSAVSSALQAELGNHFISIDDLAWGPQVELPGNLTARLEQLVTDSGGQFCRWLRMRHSQPAIQAMTEAVEEYRRSELEWMLRRLPSLSERDQALINQMSHRLVTRILHAPRSALKLDASGDLNRAAQELFGV